eukprot:403375513
MIVQFLIFRLLNWTSFSSLAGMQFRNNILFRRMDVEKGKVNIFTDKSTNQKKRIPKSDQQIIIHNRLSQKSQIGGEQQRQQRKSESQIFRVASNRIIIDDDVRRRASQQQLFSDRPRIINSSRGSDNFAIQKQGLFKSNSQVDSNVGYITLDSNVPTNSDLIQIQDQQEENKIYRLDELLKALRGNQQKQQELPQIKAFQIDTESDESQSKSQEGTRIRFQIKQLITTSNVNRQETPRGRTPRQEETESSTRTAQQIKLFSPLKLHVQESPISSLPPIILQSPMTQRNSPRTSRLQDVQRPSPLKIKMNSRQQFPSLSPFTADKLRKTNWKKISQMIQLAQDQHELDTDNLNLESSNINSACGTKRFLQRIEEDIGIKKSKFMQKPSFMKSTFKPETLRRFRQNGGVAPTNSQAEQNNQLSDYDYSTAISIL